MAQSSSEGDSTAQLRALIGSYVYDTTFATELHAHAREADFADWLAAKGFRDIDPATLNYLAGHTHKEVVADVAAHMNRGGPSALTF